MLLVCWPASVTQARPEGDTAPGPKEKPAEVTQVWPNHRNGEALPIADAKDTDPNCPTGGRMWRWQVVPPRPPEGAGPPATPRANEARARAVCGIELRATRRVGDTWTDDDDMHLAGESMTAQQTRDGRDFWESYTPGGVFRTGDCARPLPDAGFTFGATVTKKEMAKARIQRVRFLLGSGPGVGSPKGLPSGASRSIEVWTDLFGAPRNVPLTAPVTSVGLMPQPDGEKVGPGGVGLRGIVIVRGARVVVGVHDATATGAPLTVYASLERDLAGDDPSPSGLRATRAPLPTGRRVHVEASAAALDSAGKGAFVITTPDDPAAVGFSFYVQAGVGPDAASGLSCALACTVVASLSDYDGDGRPNAEDPAPLDP